MKRAITYLLLFTLFFLIGYFFHKYEHKVFSNETVTVDRELPNVSDIEIDTISIEIPDSAYQVLLRNREEALKNSLLTKEYRDKVLANLISDSDTFRIDLRLKGDKPDHWNHNFKWSFRIKIKDGKALNGIKVFNFQRPRTRGDVNEWFFHQTLKEFGLINLRFKFVKAFINGRDAGIYAIEEYFDKRLIESNGLREGITFRFDCSKYWPKEPGVNDNRIVSAPIDPFKMGKPIDDNPRYVQFKVAKDLIGGYIAGQYRTDEVFDVHKMAKYFAILDLTGYQHAAFLDNMKFYYNPLTSLIEPVGYDNQIINYIGAQPLLGDRSLLGERRKFGKKTVSFDHRSWHDNIFSDTVFQKAYISALSEVSQSGKLDAFFEKINKKLLECIALIRLNDEKYDFKGDQIFKANASYIRRFLAPNDALESYTVHKDTLNGKVQFEFQNTHYLPVEVVTLKYKDSAIVSKRTIVQSSGADNGSVNLVYSVSPELLKKRKFIDKVSFEYRILGTEQMFSCEPHHWRYFDDQNSGAIMQAKNANYKDFGFVEENENNLLVKKGSYTIESDLIVGSEKILSIEAGTNLKLINGASIISYGGISLEGNSENPISISSDGGEGILVIDSPKRSKIVHTKFLGLSNFQINDWVLPSAVTFYNSDVDIDYTSFEGNVRGDDYLNVFRSEVNLTNSTFYKTNADAFDGDFISGKISNVRFDSIGNDALDFSGSKLKLYNVFINDVADKGLSAGERTTIFCQNVEFQGCELAVNSKDDSRVDIRQSGIMNCTVGYVAFMKKTEYGPASISASKVTLEECNKDWLIEEKSTLFIDGKAQEHTHDKVSMLLYGNEYGKSSK